MKHRQFKLIFFSVLTVFSMAGLPAGSGAADDTRPIVGSEVVFEERDGLVAIEAEHFYEQTLAEKRAWHLSTRDHTPDIQPDGDPNHIAGASGGAYLELLPDTRRTHDDKLLHGENFSNVPGKMAVLSYKVHFNTPGVYWLWARAFTTTSEDNGLHFGIDGEWPETAQRWQTVTRGRWHWESRQRTEQVHTGVPGILTLEVKTAGVHTIHVSMREDGIELDKILLVNRKDYTPQGAGPDPAVKAGTLPPPFPFVAEKADAAATKPNIVVILADDMGWSDIGCYGGEIETPHLDGLAKGGLRFTQFYNTARCCPTRAALLTGLYQHQTGIGHMVGNDGLPSYQGFLNERCITVAEALKPAGYATLMTGKWHVGSAPGRWPLDRGFDRYWGTPSGGGVYFKETLQIRKEVFFVNGAERIEPPDDLYVTDAFTEHAIEFVQEAVTRRKQPFFLYLAHIAPHWPLQAKPADIAKYADRYNAGWDAVRNERFARQKEMGLVPPDAVLSPRDSQAKEWSEMPETQRNELAQRMAIYAAQIDCIDHNVGRLVAKLKELGQFENTLILFLSDNGCSAEGGAGGFSRGQPGAPIGTGLSYASAGLEWANASDTPFRKFKIAVHEGGIATPLIAHWPAGIAARGELRHQPGHVIDLMPTLLEAAGAKYPAEFKGKPLLPLEGRSLAPAWKDEPIARDALFWEHEGNKAVRHGDWKAVSQGRGAWELYDLNNDRTETRDLAARHPERTVELAALWKHWADRCGVWEWDELLKHRQNRRRKNRQ